jgi:GNAT superfamily N-acetyltransferase
MTDHRSGQVAEFSARRDPHLISTDPSRVDRRLVHQYLSTESYWARRVPFSVVDRSIDHSLNFGLYDPVEQIGYARVITDYSTFAFLRDVFLVERARGQGLGSWLMESVLAHPDLTGLRRIMLATRDAHGFYEKLGFAPLSRPDRFLSIDTPTKELYR